MSPHLILTGVSADDLLAWLPDCIARARQEIARHPLRPRPSAMIPCRIPAERLYLFARQMARSYVGIYEEAPSPGLPFGVPLLLLASGLCDTPDVPGELHLVIWRSAGFPLAVAEIAWRLQERFPSRPSPQSPLADFMPQASWGQSSVPGRRRVSDSMMQLAAEEAALSAGERDSAAWGGIACKWARRLPAPPFCAAACGIGHPIPTTFLWAKRLAAQQQPSPAL